MFVKGLLPAGTHPFSAKQFIQVFSKTKRRADLYNGALRPVSAFLSTHGIDEIFIDGSYVEEKVLWPKDIDCYFEVTLGQVSAIFGSNLPTWQKSMKNTGCDVYACLTDLANPWMAGKPWANARDYWAHQFGHTRKGKVKGFVRLQTADAASEVAP